MKVHPSSQLSGFTMCHRPGMVAVERMLLSGALPPRALLALWSIALRMHPLTGKAWTTTNELAAIHGMHPESFSRHVAVLKQLGLVVRRKERPARQLLDWERRFLPDPRTRGPHSGRLFLQVHPMLMSVGSRSKRERALEQFRDSVGDRITPFEVELAAVETEISSRVLDRMLAKEEGWQGRDNGLEVAWDRLLLGRHLGTA